MDQLPHSIGKPATRALESVGIVQLNQLASLTQSELEELHGVGPKAIRILKEELTKQNLSLRSED